MRVAMQLAVCVLVAAIITGIIAIFAERSALPWVGAGTLLALLPSLAAAMPCEIRLADAARGEVRDKLETILSRGRYEKLDSRTESDGEIWTIDRVRRLQWMPGTEIQVRDEAGSVSVRGPRSVLSQIHRLLTQPSA
jgi:hypothetical protein